MICPKCRTRQDRVADSREAKHGQEIRRRRCCLKCGHRWTTFEVLDRVLKRDMDAKTALHVLSDFLKRARLAVKPASTSNSR